jgi:hypothetical protein
LASVRRSGVVGGRGGGHSGTHTRPPQLTLASGDALDVATVINTGRVGVVVGLAVGTRVGDAVGPPLYTHCTAVTRM